MLGKDGDRKDYGMYTKGWILNWGECRMWSGCFHTCGPCREYWVRSQGSRRPQRALRAGSRTNPFSETNGDYRGQPPTQHPTPKQHPCLSLLKSSSAWEFLAGPMVRIQLFHGRGWVQSLIGGPEILQAVQCGQKSTQIQPKAREKSEQQVKLTS